MRANTTRKRDARTSPRQQASATNSSPISTARKSAKARVWATSGLVDSIEQKTCSQCGERKVTAKFLPSRFTADGLIDQCKVCVYAAAERDRRDREQRRRKFPK